MYGDVDEFAMFCSAKSAYYSSLNEAMNRQNRFFITLVYQGSLQKLLLCISKAKKLAVNSVFRVLKVSLHFVLKKLKIRMINLSGTL